MLMLESLVEPREGSRRPPRRASARQLLGQVRAPLAPRPATFQPTRAPSVVAGAAPVALDATVGEQGQQMARCSPTCSWLLAAACCGPKVGVRAAARSRETPWEGEERPVVYRLGSLWIGSMMVCLITMVVMSNMTN